tara:strand:+ start:588 stop:1064 length:477 start_codon:yes stop_codon:yes gene_type:complete
MANRKITVLNPAGYQELFQSGDNLIVDGAVNLQSNGLTGVPTPSINLDAANKSYVDTGDNANSSAITLLDTRLTTVEGDLSGGIPTVNDSSVTFVASTGITITGDNPFTLNGSSDVSLTIEGPDVSGFLSMPSSDGDYIVTTSGGTTTYSDVIDLGSY